MLSWNLGGKGVRASECVIQDLGESVSMILLQELKIDAGQMGWLKLWFKKFIPKYTGHINIRKSKRAGQQLTGIATLIHEQLAKGVKRVRHSLGRRED